MRKTSTAVDTPKAGPVKVTNTRTGLVQIVPPLSLDERRKLARSRKLDTKISLLRREP